MKVNLYDDTAAKPYAKNVDLRECFPDDDESYQEAFSELRDFGRYWTGGGAAPLILITRVDRA